MNESLNKKHVLITGASTGIGEACALSLAARGWQVFAGVRKSEDGEALVKKAGASLTPILLDVTKPEQIAGAVDFVRERVGSTGLQGLVNNAGIVVAGPLEFIPISEVEWQLQVNVVGVVAVTQAFLPMIRTSHGRIVITGSNSGFWCEPFAAPYGASKHALEAIADSLRVELYPWGIEVALVQPGMIRTPIWEKSRAAAEDLHAKVPPEGRELYAPQIAALRSALDKAPKLAIPPERVARAITHALEARRPKTRYRVGLDSRLQGVLRHVLPDRLRDRINRLVMGL
ncbi:MAG TPA: SDR family oxidoreductase [Candidatus Hydrogenedentes bacterium]|nr:SDR family oxidoreductase [Candidatus Hydrogenedentota bacterium]